MGRKKIVNKLGKYTTLQKKYGTNKIDRDRGLICNAHYGNIYMRRCKSNFYNSDAILDLFFSGVLNGKYEMEVYATVNKISELNKYKKKEDYCIMPKYELYKKIRTREARSLWSRKDVAINDYITVFTEMFARKKVIFEKNKKNYSLTFPQISKCQMTRSDELFECKYFLWYPEKIVISVNPVVSAMFTKICKNNHISTSSVIEVMLHGYLTGAYSIMVGELNEAEQEQGAELTKSMLAVDRCIHRTFVVSGKTLGKFYNRVTRKYNVPLNTYIAVFISMIAQGKAQVEKGKDGIPVLIVPKINI